MKDRFAITLPEGVDPLRVLRRLSGHFAAKWEMRTNEVTEGGLYMADPSRIWLNRFSAGRPGLLARGFSVRRIRFLAIGNELLMEVKLGAPLWAVPMATGLLGPIVAVSLFHGVAAACAMLWRVFPIMEVIMLFCSIFLLVPTFLVREMYVSSIKKQIKSVMLDSFDHDVSIRRVKKRDWPAGA